MKNRALASAALVITLGVVLVACGQRTQISEESVTEPVSKESSPKEALATFAGGCFWCTEAVFKELDGVLAVESGYTGGGTEKPTYEEVAAGLTGHAEGVQIRYDPARVTYEELLEVFFKTHDPTTLNRQGADVGTQYRSAIFVHDAAQRETAQRILTALDDAGAYDDPIVTEIVELEVWFPAEGYHQDYFASNPSAGYCRVVIAPKLAKFRKVFADRLKKDE